MSSFSVSQHVILQNSYSSDIKHQSQVVVSFNRRYRLDHCPWTVLLESVLEEEVVTIVQNCKAKTSCDYFGMDMSIV